MRFFIPSFPVLGRKRGTYLLFSLVGAEEGLFVFEGEDPVTSFTIGHTESEDKLPAMDGDGNINTFCDPREKRGGEKKGNYPLYSTTYR